MEKAKIEKSGKGWLITFSDTGKQLTLNWINLPANINNEDIEVLREKGQPVEIKWGEKTFKKPALQSKKFKKENRREQSDVQKRIPARAPYNFIPLNENIVAFDDISKHNIWNGWNGKILISMKTKSPLYIGGDEGIFFSANSLPSIPGSTLRGLIRNLITIISYGKMSQYENRILYRRSNLMDDGDNAKAGFLKLNNGNYTITEARATQISGDHELRNRPYSYEYSHNKCVFSTGEFPRGGSIIWEINTINNATSKNVSLQVIHGYESDDTRAENAIDLIKSLKKGKIVDKNDDFIGDVPIPPGIGIPVFYRLDSTGNIHSIGHAKYHRVPYKYSLEDLIKQEPKNVIDFGDSIFGTTECSSKVFFENLSLDGHPKYELQEPEHPKVLSSPKPTTYQHYLEQPDGIQTTYKRLKKWSDSDAVIRGFKNYWHRITSGNKNDSNTWIETGAIKKSNPDKINPIQIGSTFKGYIRFENLSNEELGALLFVLDLPEECAHKLGMGKPLGLGTVRIDVQDLILINRNDRYKKLFTVENNGSIRWNSGEEHTNSLTQFKNAFAKYICHAIKESYDKIKGYECLWKVDRIEHLKIMLTWPYDNDGNFIGFGETQSLDWLKRTRYQELPEFKKRPVLPTPREVIDKDTYDDC